MSLLPPPDVEGLSAEELEAEAAIDLPDREALSIVSPTLVPGAPPLPIGRTSSLPPGLTAPPATTEPVPA